MNMLIAFKLFGSLALLMFGMKAMSDSLQKLAGPQLRHILGAMTTNRFTGVLTGTFVTAAVQSSTATTLMTVSFVNAGLLALQQAIAVIMGAHIGTTVTAWIMSLGFSFNITNVVYPAFFFGIILIYMKRRRIIGDLLFGLAFLFLGLATLKETGFALLDDADTRDAITSFFSHFNTADVLTSLLFLLVGTLLTVCVQSSAAIMAITMMLCSTGVLHIEQGVMLVLGENIGTTITSNIVSLSANTQARRAAFAHFTINVIGVVWALLLIRPFFELVCSIVGFDNTLQPSSPSFAVKASVLLATFHSAFNIANTSLLIWVVPQIEHFVTWAIRTRTNEDEDFGLHFIQSGIMKTPELSVLEAEKEITAFAERIQRMFGFVKDMLLEEDKAKAKQLYERIEKYENISDNMELEIAKYLDNVSNAHLSDETKQKIRAMLREISEIESIGDACYNIARSINRRNKDSETFTTQQQHNLLQMMDLTNQALTQMNNNLQGKREQLDSHTSFNIENEINNYRSQLKAQNIIDLNEHRYSYGISTIYMDIVAECEKLGDYVVNVVEARIGQKQKY